MVRCFISFGLGCALAMSACGAAVFQATGIKIGEVTTDHALVWTRLTRVPEALADGVMFVAVDKPRNGMADGQIPNGRQLDEMQYAVPGAAGEVRVVWRAEIEGSEERATPWHPVDPAADFTCQLTLEELVPGAWHRLRVESRAPDGAPGEIVEGRFRAAIPADEITPVRFIVSTCHDDWRRDHPEFGFEMYAAAKTWAPDFFVQTGDFVYLDKALPFGVDEALARFKWNRTSAWRYVREFYRNCSAYFLKDDHDVLGNDSAPGMTFGRLTWERGIEIEYEQLPMPRTPPYRTLRWGRDVEVWLLESREFRQGGKTAADPANTVLGAEQKAWLQQTLAASNATFRIVVTGTPIVGPNVDYKTGDRGDSLADDTFRHEGEEIRRLLAGLPGVVVITGDRHWQYHSVDPVTGLHEFGCGPTCFGMAEGFVSKVKRTPMHRFLRIDGGFLSVVSERVEGRPMLTLRHHDALGNVQYEHAFEGTAADR